jgi:hypothetical protein
MFKLSHFKVLLEKLMSAPTASRKSRPSSNPREGTGTTEVQKQMSVPPTTAGSRHLSTLT